MKFTRVLRVALASVVFVAAPAFADDFKREGEGDRRAALDKMELKPFAAENWAKLSEWTNGAAVSPADTGGKVVVICTWADWYAPCKRSLIQAQKLAEKYGKENIVVVAAHDSRGWAEAKKPAAGKDAAFILALDAQGDFRKALMADQDPNFYVIDRAGQMRFADIDKASLEPAVEMLIKESANDAGGINAKIAKNAADKDAQNRKSSAINSGASLVDLPEIPFTDPGAEAYKKAAWPKMPKLSDNEQPTDPNQPPASIVMKLPEAGWIGPKPNTKGRAALLYFWHPDSRFTHEDTLNRMDLIKTQRSRDLVVVGVVSKLSDNSNDTNKLELDPKKLLERVNKFLSGRDIKQAILMDVSGGLFEASKRGRSGGDIPLPWVAIVSSDGVCRWSGWMGFPSFEAGLEQVLRVDPGVQARRAAEAEYLRNQGK